MSVYTFIEKDQNIDSSGLHSVDADQTIRRARRDKISKDRYSILRKQYKVAVDSEVRREDLEKMKSLTDPHKTVWKVINSNTNGSKTKEIKCAITASEFNSYFIKLPEILIPTPADSEKCKKYVTNVKSSDFGSMFLKPTTPEEILTTMSKLKNKSSCDYYGFNVRVHKRVMQSLADPLS
ncbi:hypothetical protein HHI36_009654 [Cryptolaemus montrouzieri]|uniref:Uncharacterized protein n=1 Tax=Cryptolaemus montrouzieri TaxID=559131 RepID=A0ABD2MGH1_9CUCU